MIPGDIGSHIPCSSKSFSIVVVAALSRCFMPFISIEALKKCTVSCTSGPEITVKERLSEFRREESVNGYHQIGREAVLIFPFRIQIFRYLPPSEDFAMFLDGRMKG